MDDVRPFISSHALYIIPLRIGGGTRIKAYEAMAMGKAMVSTVVGVEGSAVRCGEHLTIADDPEDICGPGGTIAWRCESEDGARVQRSVICSGALRVGVSHLRLCPRVP